MQFFVYMYMYTTCRLYCFKTTSDKRSFSSHNFYISDYSEQEHAIGQDVQWTDSQADPHRSQRPLCGMYKKHRLFIWQFVQRTLIIRNFMMLVVFATCISIVV